mgnify:CR=1
HKKKMISQIALEQESAHIFFLQTRTVDAWLQAKEASELQCADPCVAVARNIQRNIFFEEGAIVSWMDTKLSR